MQIATYLYPFVNASASHSSFDGIRVTVDVDHDHLTHTVMNPGVRQRTERVPKNSSSLIL